MLMVIILSQVLTPLPQTFLRQPAFPQSKHYFALSPEVFVGLTPHSKSQSNPEEGMCVHLCVCTCVQDDCGEVTKGSHITAGRCPSMLGPCSKLRQVNAVGDA